MDKNNKKGLFDCILYGFAVIGVIATLLLLVALGGSVWFWYADPFGIKDYMNPSQWQQQIDTQVETSSEKTKSSNTSNLPFTEQQLQMMSAFGIDTERLQNMDPQKLQSCTKNKLGEERYRKIISGEVNPNFSDVNKFKECVN